LWISSNSSTAAIANASVNATGVRINKLPLSAENVLRWLKEAGEGVKKQFRENSS